MVIRRSGSSFDGSQYFPSIPLLDLGQLDSTIRCKLDAAIERIVDSQCFYLMENPDAFGDGCIVVRNNADVAREVRGLRFPTLRPTAHPRSSVRSVIRASN